MSGLLDECVLALGALLIVLSVRMFYRTRAFIARCRIADGRITHYDTEPDSDSGVEYYFARVRFRDVSGAEHEIYGSGGLREPPTVGRQVQVTYDPTYPANAWPTGSKKVWFLPWLVLLLGVATIVIGFVVRAEG